MSAEYEVTVRVGFPVSAAKAREVLERWWAQKKARTAYMRKYRSGGAKREGDVPRGAGE